MRPGELFQHAPTAPLAAHDGLPLHVLDREIERDVIDGVEVAAVTERGAIDINFRVVDQATVWAVAPGIGDLTASVRAGARMLGLAGNAATTGHAALDDRYLVEASDVAALRLWLTRDDATRVCATYDAYTIQPFALTLRPGWVSMQSAAYRDAADVPNRPYVAGAQAAKRAVAGLAARGRALASAWAQRLAPLGLESAEPIWRTDLHYQPQLVRGRARVWLDFPWQLPWVPYTGLRTRVRTHHPRKVSGAVWRSSLARAHRPRIERVRRAAGTSSWRAVASGPDALPPLATLAGVLERCRADWFVVEPGVLAIGWERIMDDAGALDVATTALATWSTIETSEGPYR